MAECISLQWEGRGEDARRLASASPDAGWLQRGLDSALKVGAFFQEEPRPPQPGWGEDPLLGRTIDGFRVLRVLGEGAMSRVYLCRQEGLNRPAALKVLRAAARPADVERFLREGRTLARLSHKNILSVYAVGHLPGGGTYIAAQYVPGVPLSAVVDFRRNAPAAGEAEVMDFIRRRATGKEGARTFVSFATDLMAQVAEALRASHACGVIHRDVKPSNILLSEDGQTVLADFGLTLEQGRERMTLAGEVLGTPLYLPPECLWTDSSRADPRSDIYSLGAAFYEVFTGRPPFDGDNLRCILKRIETDRPPPPRRWNASLPADLENVLLKCLEKSPNRRYQSAAALCSDLDRLRGGRPVRARGPAFRPSRLGYAALAAAVAMAAASLLQTRFSETKAAPKPRSPVLPAALHEESPARRAPPAAPDPMTHQKLAFCLMELGRYADARDEFLKAFRNRPDDAALAFRAGEMAFRLGDFKAAADFAGRAVALDGRNEEYVRLLGRAHARLNEPKAAESCFRTALALNPGNFQSHVDLHDLLAAQGRRREALNELLEAQRLSPPYADPDGLFLVQAPPGWAVRTGVPSKEYTVFRSGDGRASFSVRVCRNSRRLPLDQVLREIHDASPGTVTVLRREGGRLAGRDAVFTEFLAVQDSVQVKGLMALLGAGDILVQVKGYASPRNYPEFEPFIQRMVENFRLSPAFASTKKAGEDDVVVH